MSGIDKLKLVMIVKALLENAFIPISDKAIKTGTQTKPCKRQSYLPVGQDP